MFTTRPEILGTFGVVASTHWIASAVGMSMLERGGNAFDAAVATGLVLQVVEPHLNGPGGDLPLLFHSARTGTTEVLCGQGTAPAAATIDAYRNLGLDLVPGSGLLATVVPGAFGAWMALLRDHGTLPLEDVMAPAIHYAAAGHPTLARVSTTIAGLGDFFAAEWPSSAAVFLPDGQAPAPAALFRNPALASTYRRIVKEATAAGGGREAVIERAHAAFYRGFVAEAIDGFARTTEAMDSSGRRNKGLITGHDMAGWHPAYEAPTSFDYHGWTVHKTGPWGQGPVLLQALALLRDDDLADLDATGPEFIHRVVEAMKLAFADREAYYGDPAFSEVPMAALLAEDYVAERRSLLGEDASFELRPGVLPGFAARVERTRALLRGRAEAPLGVGAGEPTMAHLVERRGDTVHLDVIDRFGNMVSATPSGGWLQSSPVVPELGFPLNTRAQMFWLDDGHPNGLAPGKRPRSTLSPTLASFEGRPTLAFGTPGGDQQDQWQLILFLRHVHHERNLQAAIDAPLFHTTHFPSSFYPRGSQPGRVFVEEQVGEATLAALRARGHEVEVAQAWSIGRLTAARRDGNGLLRAAATPRLMQAYAVGR